MSNTAMRKCSIINGLDGSSQSLGGCRTTFLGSPALKKFAGKLKRLNFILFWIYYLCLFMRLVFLPVYLLDGLFEAHK